MQTSGSAPSSAALATHAARDPATDRRTAERDDNGGGDATLFSDLVARADAHLEARTSAAGEEGSRRGKQKPATADADAEGTGGAPATAMVPLQPAPAAGPPAGSGSGRHRSAHDGALTAGGRAAGAMAAAGHAESKAAAASAAAATDATTVATASATDSAAATPATAAMAAAQTLATDGAGRGADNGRNPSDAGAGRSTNSAQAQLPGTALAALQAALREAGGAAADPAAAAARAAAAAAGADSTSGDRGNRLRRAEAATNSRANGAAARDLAATLDGHADAALAKLSSSASSSKSAGDSAGGTSDGAGTRLSATAAGIDQGVFSLTMNNVAAGSSAQRTESAIGLAGGPTQTAIDVPVDHADFAEAFARQSAGLIVQGSSQAEIRLNPLDMGPIRIAISLDADAATLDIQAAHADTRAAIEASMPALRQMLADQGVRLAEYRVDSQSTSDRQQQATGDPGRHGSGDPGPRADGSQSGARTSGDGAGASVDDGSAHALSSGFGNGRGDQAGGTSALDRGNVNDRQHRSDPLRSPAGPPGTSGHRGGAGSGRIDLYA